MCGDSLFDFTIIGLPHGEDALSSCKSCPDDDGDSLVEAARRNEALRA
jgi:hypothetical protein